MNASQEEFYVNGIYFREGMDIKKYREFYKWIKSVNCKKQMLNKECLKYAMFEILAEYKRRGLSKKEIFKTMSMFGIAFLAKELCARKKRARIDGYKCVEAARKIGLEQSGGTMEFPVFTKR